jgi:hypothetical protein
MGRKKITLEEKKDRLSITISAKNLEKFDEFDIKNKSRLIEWLLNNHFESLKK